MKTHSRLAILALLGTALCGCGAMDRIDAIGTPPKLAEVGNPAEKDIVSRIPRGAPITNTNNSLWQAGAKSFFHDPRASHVGDVITVNVTVADTAKLSNSTARTRANSDDAGLTNFFGLESVLPTAMTPGSARALEASIFLMRAWACGLRLTRP